MKNAKNPSGQSSRFGIDLLTSNILSSTTAASARFAVSFATNGFRRDHRQCRVRESLRPHFRPARNRKLGVSDRVIRFKRAVWADDILKSRNAEQSSLNLYFSLRERNPLNTNPVFLKIIYYNLLKLLHFLF
nr:hypothetical protein [Paenibacillus sp. J2TS4]